MNKGSCGVSGVGSAVQQLLDAQPQAGASVSLLLALYLEVTWDFSGKAEREITALLLDLKVKNKTVESETKCAWEYSVSCLIPFWQ